MRVGQDRRLVGLDLAARAVHQLGRDPQVAAPAVGVVQLGDERQHERRGQRPDVVDAVGLVLVEQGVAPGVDLTAVLGHDRPQQALAITEVVLQRRRVALLGFAVDLAQRHAVDAAVGEQLLGGAISDADAVGPAPPFDALAIRRPYRRRAPDAGPSVRAAGSSLRADGPPRPLLDADDGQGDPLVADPARRRRRGRRRGCSACRSCWRRVIGVARLRRRRSRLAMPQRPDAGAGRVDPFTVSEPWRQFVQGAQRARRRFQDTVAQHQAGPLHDRLQTSPTRLDAGLAEGWAVAKRGHEIDAAVRRLDPTRAALAAGHAAGPGRRARRSANLDGRHRVGASSSWPPPTASRRCRRRPPTSCASTRPASTSCAPGPPRSASAASDTDTFAHDVDDLVLELEGLRQAVQELPG